MYGTFIGDIVGGNEKNAAAFLLSVKTLRQSGAALTLEALRTRSAQYLQDGAFLSTVSSRPSTDLGAMIQSGVFEERMAELQEDQRFVADLPTLQSIWAGEKSTRLIRTQQICDKVIAARKAMGDWPEENNPPAPEQKAKKADKGKAPAPRKAPAMSTGQGKQDAEKHTTIIQAKNG
ncbi:MAG: hypothetical protein IKQ04_09630 [Oscillospiraceae bacterium]|nr:hypothetical protein [Oscillospiraceae bacterium]